MKFASYKKYKEPIEVPFWDGDEWANGYYWLEPLYGGLLGPPKQWEFEKLGFFPYGRGDSAWRAGLGCIAYPGLLFDYAYETQWERLRYLGPIPERKRGCSKFRHPYHTFSRDQRIMGMAGLFVAGYQDEVYRLVSSGKAFDQPLNPAFSMRPDLKYWLKYLAYGDTKDAKKFHKWLRLEVELFGYKHAYALHLASWMLYCCPDQLISETLIVEHIPEWNYLLRILNQEYIPKSIIDTVDSWEGYQWQQWEQPSLEKKPWPDVKMKQDEFFKLDVDVLNAVWNREFKEVEHWIN
jgi:hypothetical protein